MQDNDAAEKAAAISIFGQQLDLNDCAVHFGRELDQRVEEGDRKQKKATQEAMRTDFFMITKLPDTSAQAQLREIAVSLYMKRWQHKQKAAAEQVWPSYFVVKYGRDWPDSKINVV